MNLSLKEKSVVIIGGSSGIGLEVAKICDSQGAKVTIASRNRKKLDAAAEFLSKNCRSEEVDVLKIDSVEKLFKSISKIDHLCYTPAPGEYGEFTKFPIESAKKHFDGRFWGCYSSAFYALDNLAKQGSITFVSGGLSRKPLPGKSIITAAQWAMEGLGKALAVELAPIRVNTVVPGLIDTPLWDFMEDTEKKNFFENEQKGILTGKVGQVDEVADVVVGVMRNNYITGASYVVDGGSSLM